MNSFYSNLNDLTTINATDINAQEINTNQLNLTGGIYNGGNSITFTPITNYTNFLENVHIYKNLYLEYNNETLNVGQLLISGGGGGGGSVVDKEETCKRPRKAARVEVKGNSLILRSLVRYLQFTRLTKKPTPATLEVEFRRCAAFLTQPDTIVCNLVLPILLGEAKCEPL